MKLGRYHNRPQPESLSSLKKKTFPSYRSYESLPKNPQLTRSVKLPVIDMKRSSSIMSLSSQRNSKIAVERVEMGILKLEKDLQREKMSTNQSLQCLKYMREKYVEYQFPKLHNGLKENIKNIRKYLGHKKREYEIRSGQIKQSCNSLWERTEQVRQMVFELRMRIERIEGVMGE